MEIEINYSFIIPHRNVPHLLQRCIDSIPKRDDIQIIILQKKGRERDMPGI